MRHPIVERIDTSCEYVVNDIALGNVVDGVLLLELMHVGNQHL